MGDQCGRPRRVSLAGAPEPRVEGVAEGVSEQVEGKHGETDRRSGYDGGPPGGLPDRSRLLQHPAPAWVVSAGDPKPEEADRRLSQDRDADLNAGNDDDRRRDVDKNVTVHDP